MFTEGNTDDMFSIDPVAGNIILSRSLDWETHSQYNLTVQASDGFLHSQCHVSGNQWQHMPSLNLHTRGCFFCCPHRVCLKDGICIVREHLP